MRVLAGLMFGLLAMSGAQADPDDNETVEFINDRLAEDRYYSTHGYAVSLADECVVEFIPKGSAWRGQKRRRVALHVLDRRGAERLDSRYDREGGRYEGTWIHLVGRFERDRKRKGFPASIDRDEKGFPKYDEEMLTYGIEFWFHDKNIARDVAQAFVTLASDCDPADLR